MFGTVTTNGASILTIITLWSTLTWAVTYIYMNNKMTKLQMYIDAIEFEYGDLLDDYFDHMYGDVKSEDYAEYELNDKGNWYRVN